MQGDEYRGRQTPLDVAAHDRGIEDPNPATGPRVAMVPETHVNDTFDVDGIETKRREALLEALLADREGVSAASATGRNGTVGVHHDPSVSRDDIRAELGTYGLLVAPGDEAFASRRAAQFDSARVAVAVLFGLMVAVPYVGVLYPTRVEWLFYDPVTVAYLQSILDSRVATHFFVNLAALAGIAFIVACGPIVDRAVGAARVGRVTNEVVFVGGVLAVYGYSTLAAFTGFGGNVHYDLVAYATVAATLWTHSGAESVADSAAEDPEVAAEPPAPSGDEEPVAMTDGGR